MVGPLLLFLLVQERLRGCGVGLVRCDRTVVVNCVKFAIHVSVLVTLDGVIKAVVVRVTVVVTVFVGLISK